MPEITRTASVVFAETITVRFPEAEPPTVQTTHGTRTGTVPVRIDAVTITYTLRAEPGREHESAWDTDARVTMTRIRKDGSLGAEIRLGRFASAYAGREVSELVDALVEQHAPRTVPLLRDRDLS